MRTIYLIAATATLAATTASACLWNYDTTAFEQVGGTDLDNSLFGWVPHHSEALWQWRVRDRRERLKQSPDDLILVDDLAVALEKTGRVDEAIELTRPVVEANPRRYESLANLGTLLVHAGDLEAGAAFIRQAIEVNPDAHFGREAYQLHLVEYLRQQREAGVVGLPLRGEGPGFAAYLRGKFPIQGPYENGNPRSDNSEFLAAVRGLQGMLQFGNFESPVLHEAIGDVLAETGQTPYAAIAYRQAARFAEDAAAAYRELSDALLGPDAGAVFNDDFAEHVAAAADFRREVSDRESSAIAAFDADAAAASPDDVALAYFEANPEFPTTAVREVTLNPNAEMRVLNAAIPVAVWAVVLSVASVFAAAVFFGLRHFRRRRPA